MEYFDFLNRVIDEGIEAAKADYTKPEQKDRLEGSIEGFESCRGKNTEEILALLKKARADTHRAFREESLDYWRVRCREGEIEWTCNVMSAAISNVGMKPIVPVTARGMMKAAEILAEGGLRISDETPVTA
jgi:hypothetical protein